MPQIILNRIVKICFAISLVACTSFLPTGATQFFLHKNAAETINAPKPKKGDVFFENLFKNNPGLFDSILINKHKWNVQIIYTQINRGKNGYAKLKNFYFNKDSGTYFYPASTVKLPIVLLALQKLNELRVKGLNINSSMITDAAYNGQVQTFNDPNTFDGRPAIAQYIKRILLVSDNEAFNRLYEFLGQQYINDELHKKGFTDAQILHRLDVFLSEDENRHTNPISFLDSATSKLLFQQPMKYNTEKYEKRSDSLGQSFFSQGKLFSYPMDFSKKNRISLQDLHTILTGLIFPEAVKASQRFNITEADRKFVLKYMSSFPSESVYPYYDSSYTDNYAKFILWHGNQDSASKSIRVFDKSGDAYGQMIDVAYVADFQKNIEFMVSAEIYCNEDGIINDDKYDYKTIGIPFMQNLGEALYRYELKRKKEIIPDLSSLKFKYDR
ncbi:MAG: serine hydrolase [Bacteroidetes bacterium]|nr:serine hydrolase [Bacteroidota bacterium]MBS1756784.1 serine hydrolase [Bacteroidota bacterium]